MMRMGRQIWNMMCVDSANTVLDPVRMGLVLGIFVYLAAGAAMIVALLHMVWFTNRAADLQAYGIAVAAWGAGLGGVLAAGGHGVLQTTKAEAVP